MNANERASEPLAGMTLGELDLEIANLRRWLRTYMAKRSEVAARLQAAIEERERMNHRGR